MKLACCLLIVIGCCFGRTTVADTILRADGSAYRGTFRIRWSTYINSGGTTVPAGYIDVLVSPNGSFSVALDANATNSPANTAYIVTYTGLRQGLTTTEYWIVPDSATPQTLANVRSSTLPSATAVVALSMLTSGGASTGNCLLWNGTTNSWGPGSCTTGAVFSLPFTSQTSVTVTHGLGTQNVLVTVLDGSNKKIIPKDWHIVDSNSVVVNFDSAKTGTINIK